MEKPATAIAAASLAPHRDGGLNTAVAPTGRQRLLNLLHGAYGVGTAIGPLVVTAAILTGSWRPAYLTQVCLDSIDRSVASAQAGVSASIAPAALSRA